MDAVFRALADPTRRSLLDRLYEEDGQSLTALEGRLPMTRIGVMNHLRVLDTIEDIELVAVADPVADVLSQTLTTVRPDVRGYARPEQMLQ